MNAEQELWNLLCPLTEEEKLQRAGKLAAKISEKRRLESELDFERKRIKKEIEKADREIYHLSEVVGNGKEKREVEVEMQRDFESKTFRVIRLDTGEIVDSRQLSESELQDDLPMDDAASPRRNKKIKGNTDARA